LKELADGVRQLKGFPPDAINVYLVADVLIDAGTRRAGRRILRQLEGESVSAHALTHAHPDHQGASDEVCGKLGLPYWVGERDVSWAEEPDRMADGQASNPFNRLAMKYWAGPGRNVDRSLREGDEVAGFRVIDVPGHTPGHVAYWRESDGVLILGDVLNNVNVTTGVPGLNDPKPYLTADPVENRRSARKLAPLEPTLVLFGHGRPLRDMRKFVDFVAALPDP
jgi:hydroxyacylglutathione hydrolase